MSSLASLTGRLERQQRQLQALNSALIAVETHSLGRDAEFDLSPDRVDQSRQTLLDFVQRLRAELDRKPPSLDVRSLVCRIISGPKPLDDWKQDLDDLIAELRSSAKVSSRTLPTMEEVLSLLDIEFAEDLQRLCAR